MELLSAFLLGMMLWPRVLVFRLAFFLWISLFNFCIWVAPYVDQLCMIQSCLLRNLKNEYAINFSHLCYEHIKLVIALQCYRSGWEVIFSVESLGIGAWFLPYLSLRYGSQVSMWRLVSFLSNYLYVLPSPSDVCCFHCFTKLKCELLWSLWTLTLRKAFLPCCQLISWWYFIC